MTLEQRVEWRYDSKGKKFPVLTITCEGVHDVGRVAYTMAHGNSEHYALARGVGRTLNRTAEGRFTLDYLEGHGGPDLRPPLCEPCEEGKHEQCWQATEFDFGPCQCYEAEGIDRPEHPELPW